MIPARGRPAGGAGQRVRELRDRLRLSQQQLAERADLDTTYISGSNAAPTEPESEHAGALAKALKVSLSALVADLRPEARVTVRRGRPPQERR